MAWTTPRTWVSSEFVTASIGNTHWRDNFNALSDRIQIVRKTVDEAVTSSTVLQNDDVLLVTAVAGSAYIGRVGLWTNSGTQLADLKVGFTFPAGTMSFGVLGLDTAATAPTGSLTTPAFPSATSGTSSVAVAAGGDVFVPFFFDFNCTTGGTVQLQWAQNTSSATALTVKAGSYIEATRVAT